MACKFIMSRLAAILLYDLQLPKASSSAEVFEWGFLIFN